jgi:ribosomal protein L25 (general stress protein Ctc)
MILGAPKLKEIANGRPLVCKGAARRGKRDGVAPATFSGHENINANIDVYQYFALLIHMSICFFGF